MSFRGYKYTFRLNAMHYTDSINKTAHRHTFEIALFIKSDTDMDKYEDVEDDIKEYFSKYTGKLLNDFEPFDEVLPTIENMGAYFFKTIAPIVAQKGFRLVRLEIHDTPQRVYRISENDLSEAQLTAIYSAMQKFGQDEILADKNALEDFEKDDDIAIIQDDNFNIKNNSTEKLPNVETDGQEVKRKESMPIFLVSLLILVVCGFLVMMYVYSTGLYPLGFDIHGHLFKSDLMYEEISNGNFYPLYTEYWYNGLEPFRYWPPMPYYFMSLLQFVVGGNVIIAYLAFIWASFVIGGIGFLLFGKKLGRPFMGLFFGLMWFILPDNIRVFFSEGNLPRMFITMLLPLLFYFIWRFVNYKKKSAIFPIIIIMLLAVLGHLMISAMIGVGVTVFLLIYAIANKRWKQPIIVVATMLSSFALAGVWVYPSLIGGMVSMGSGGSGGITEMLSRTLSVSLNPMVRFDDITELYFGLIIAIIALVGVFLSNKKSVAGFLSMIIVILGSTTALTPLLQKLPLGELFWMRRFAPIAYGLFIIAMLEWKTLRKPLMVAMSLLIVIDTLPSLNLYSYDEKMDIPSTVSDFDKTMYDYLLTQAKELTQQRVSLMDLSHFGPLPSYAFGTMEEKTPYVFGWAWQGATTAYNISTLNEALENKDYLYVFDRNLELGADTVLIDRTFVKTESDMEKLFQAADVVGYKLGGQSEFSILFSLYREEGNFGTVTDYKGLAIGTTARLVPQILHYYRPGDKLTIDEYTVEELMEYDMIYLSGFFYNDKKVAENIVREAAENGVQVYVDMSRIPTDPLTSRMTFLDISAQPITFYNKLPDLIVGDEVTKPLDFSEDESVWNTVFINDLKETSGYAWFGNQKLDFIGTGDTDNITFIGFNILYHSLMTYDEGVGEILSEVMEIDRNQLPEREIIPLDIVYEKGIIKIESDYDNVNTSLAFNDSFRSEQNIRSVNNMLFVDKGTTIITIEYPFLKQGIAITAIGLILNVLIIFWIYKKRNKKTILQRGEF